MIDSPIYVYVAGPLSLGDTTINVRRAVDVADALASHGRIVPFVPHLSHFWHFAHMHPYEFWLDMDLAWLEKCDAVLRLSGSSMGADREVSHAKQLGIPVFYNISSLVMWAEER